MNSQNRLLSALHGFNKAPKERFNLLVNRVLDRQEFLVYEFCLAITTWDDIHYPDRYGSFNATNREIGELLGGWSESNISRIRNRLAKKGYLKELDNGRTWVKDFDEWRLRIRDVSEQAKSAYKQDQLAQTQKPPAPMQEDHSQNNNYPLISSKYHLDKGLTNELSDDEVLKTVGSSVKEDLSYDELDKIIYDLDCIKPQNNNEVQKPTIIGEMTSVEQLAVCKEAFGQEVEWTK